MRGYPKLVHAIGEAAASALCAAKGGRAVYVPQRGTGALGVLLSAEQVDRMRDAFGGGIPYTVPMGPWSVLAVARRRGLELLEDGWSPADVAREVRVSPTAVKVWRRRLKSQLQA